MACVPFCNASALHSARNWRVDRARRQFNQIFKRYVCRTSLPAGRSRVGVPDYEAFVAKKMKTAEDLPRTWSNDSTMPADSFSKWWSF